MTSVPARPTRRLRSLTLRQALFVFLAAGLVAALTATVIPGPTASAKTFDGSATRVAFLQTPGQSEPAQPSDLLEEVQGVARVMRATMELVNVTMAEEPTADEVATLRAQMTLVGLRVERVSERVHQARAAMASGSAQASASTNGMVQPDLPAADAVALRTIVATAQEVVDLLRPTLTDPAGDPIMQTKAEAALLQLEALLTPVRDVLTARLASRALPVDQAPARPAWPAPAISTTVVDDLRLLSELGELTRLLGLVVSEFSAQPSVGAPQASGATPQPTAPASQGPHVHGSTAPTPLAGQPPMPGASADPMATMMQHMQDMMSMMAGMGSSASPSGANAASGGAAATPGAPPTSDAALRREVNTSKSMLQVQPLNLGVPGLATLDFYITFDSHGENLVIDLPATAQLSLPSGRRMLPLRWVGPTAGKHIEGTLVFPLTTENGSPALPASGVLELMINDPAADGSQRFTWDVGALP